jgi:hypothetical protein
MAESPACWKEAELVIQAALSDYAYDRDRGVIGSSLVFYVANALRQAGHLNDADEPYIGWERLREHQAERARLYAERQAQAGSPVGDGPREQAGPQGNSQRDTGS